MADNDDMMESKVGVLSGCETPEDIEVRVLVRLGTEVLYATKITVNLDDCVDSLKCKMYKMDESLALDLMIVVFCGQIMEDHERLSMYDLHDGATVHLFKKIKQEKIIVPETISEADVEMMLEALRSIPYNRKFKAALLKLKKIEVLNEFILKSPGLNEDPVSITLLTHPELLELYDRNDFINLINYHPAIAFALIKILSEYNEKNMQESSDTTRSLDNNSDDEDIEDPDDSALLSGFRSEHTITSRNLPFRPITTSQLASALANVTAELQPSTSTAINMGNILVPSTSGSSTSSATNTGNMLVPSTSRELAPGRNTRNTSRQLRFICMPSQLQIMRNMGLTNDTLNSEALRRTGDLGLAIDLVLSGFSTSDIV